MLDGFEDRSGAAVCTFGFCRGPGQEPILFQGRTEVGIVSIYTHQNLMSRAQLYALAGRRSLVCHLRFRTTCSTKLLTSTGWDPIFEHQGKTYAEMEKEEKVCLLICVLKQQN